MHLHPPTVVIENLVPLIDGGLHPVKRAVGEDLTVEADIFKDGHDVVSAVLKWRPKGETRWHETPMKALTSWDDRWRGTCSLFANTSYEYTIEAWGDLFFSWQHEFDAKHKAGQADLKSETLEGALLVERASTLAAARKEKADAKRLSGLAAQMRAERAGGDPRDRAQRRIGSAHDGVRGSLGIDGIHAHGSGPGATRREGRRRGRSGEARGEKGNGDARQPRRRGQRRRKAR